MNKFIILWVVGVIINLALLAALVAVAWHFIAKFW